MSLIHPSHKYKVIVTNAEDPKQPNQSITHNGVRIQIPCGREAILPGTHVQLIENCGTEMPETERDYRGFVKQVGIRFVPRFNVRIIEDLTAKQNMNLPPIPAGGRVIEPEKIENKIPDEEPKPAKDEKEEAPKTTKRSSRR